MRKFVITLSFILLASFGAAQKQDLLTMPINVGNKFTCGKTYIGGNAMVKAIGDVNGDLISDIAISFPYADAISSLTAANAVAPGLVAIIYGGANLANGIDVCNFMDTSVGFRIKGPASSNFGFNVVSMGDLNNDCLQDLAIAAPLWNGVGRVFIIYTPAINGRRQEYNVGALSSYTLSSVTANANLGTYMADPVDYNGDGLKDVLIGNKFGTNDANAYIFFGQTSKSNDIATNMLNSFTGVTLSQDPTTVADAGFGRLPLISCADFNQDTTADYVIMGTNNIFILYGYGSRAMNERVTVSNAQGEIISLGSGLTFDITKSVTCADLDMDGRQELIVSLSDGNVHVLYGSSIKGLSSSTVSAKTYNQGFIITQIGNTNTFGSVLKRTDGWNGYAQDVLLLSETTSSQVYALYASSGSFNSSTGLISYVIDNMLYPQQGFKVWTNDASYKLGSSMDATYDVNGDGVKDLLVAEGASYNSYAFYGQCQAPSGCACPNNMKYKNGYCVNWGLSGGQKVGIIIGVILGALLLIALGVLVLKKTSCGSSCFESYAKPAYFGSHTHAPIPQTMATSA